LELVADYCGAKIFVDFAHTPDGLEKSLQALKKHVKGKLFCLFGCGGNRDRTKRPLMGQAVARNADFSVITSDNPRYEDPMDIIAAIEKGYRSVSNRYIIVPDRERAIEYALDLLSSGDVLLVAGKGAEEYQEIMGIKYLFCDNDFIKKTIRGKGETPLR
jgi:UDP-N-acetylmuramoyl-L-alanyl-D-glutamate--2,6-diaminopimelate ligase